MFYSGVCFGTNNLEEAGKFYDVVFKSINVVRCQPTQNDKFEEWVLDLLSDAVKTVDQSTTSAL